jgi:hypothetical protein
MQPKDAEEELAERIKYLNEEVPPEAHVWREIWEQQPNTIGGSQEVP